MRTYWKDVLPAGRFYPPALDGEAIEFTTADLRDMLVNGNGMIGSGWSVPLCFEHDKAAVPFGRAITPAERRARGFVGRARRFAIHGGRLQVLAEVDDDDAPQVEKIGFVSPYIGFDVRTGDGRVWRGPVIEHIAVTPVPVNPDQKPFRRVGNSHPSGVAVSLARACSNGLALSLADYGGNMAEELTTDDADENTEKSTASDVDTGVAMSEDDKPSASEGDGELTALIEQDGLYVPAEAFKDFDQFKMALTISLKTKMNMGGDTAAAEEGDLAQETPEGGPTGDVPMDAAVAPPTDMGGGGEYGLSLADASARLIKHGREDLQRRLDKLLKTGRITPNVFAKEKSKLASAKLALSRSGDLEGNDVATRIEGYEALPGNKDRAKDNVALSRTGAITEAMPSDMRDPPQTEKEASPILDAWAKATGTLR